MERPDKNTPNEPINLPFNKQQRQQLLLRSVSRKIKFKIPKDELKDEDFDQIVVETSHLVTMNMQMQQFNNNDTSQNDLDSAPGKAPDSKETIRQSGECSPDFDWSSQTNEPVLMSGSGGAGARARLANQPKRPMNAFMVWGQAIRRALHKKFSNVQNAVLSKALGRVWKRLELSEKEPYITRANIIKSNHKRDYPNYRYQPRRIQEKQRRMQQTNHHINCHNLKQQRQAQQKTIHLPTNSVLRRSNRPVDVITSATQVLFEGNVTTTGQVSNLVPVQDYISTQAPMKAEHHHDGDLWKTKALYTTNSSGCGEGDAAAGSVLEYGGFLAKKFPHHQEAKYYRFEPHDPQVGSEYHLPSIEFDRGDGHTCVKQVDHTIEQNHQLLLDDNHHHQHRDEQHQARLFYYNSAENLKQTDVQMMSQPVASNLCIDHLAPHQHLDQSTISIDSYNSNYRQQFQQLQEEEEVTEQHQRQLAQHDLDDFSQYRQAGNGHLQYYDADGHYNQNNLDHHHHHHHHHHHTLQQQQQQHLPFIRQMNEFAQTADHGTHRVYTQTENYHAHRSHSDEICPV